MKYKVANQIDSTPVTSMDVGNIEIVVDDDHINRVELYILDAEGNRIEGGTFDLGAFMMHVRDFYNRNY